MVNEVIARQSGVLSRAQALAFGITDTVLRRRVNTGRRQRRRATFGGASVG